MKNLFIFLLKKSSNIKFIDLFFVEFECLLQTFLNLFPGNFGILIRGFLYKLFIFRNCEFPFIQKDVCFVHCKKITFGKNFTVNSFTYINAIGNIKFGDNVWLTMNVIVLPGVEIGSNTIIGAGSVVTKSIPANVIAAGNPAKVIREKRNIL